MPPVDLSLSSLLLQATAGVQVVLLVLAGCSVLCWGVIAEKVLVLGRFQRQAWAFDQWVRSGATAIPASQPLTRRLIDAAGQEGSKTAVGDTLNAQRDRLERALRDGVAAECLAVEKRLSLLATLGSASPFIGLFGTVWGIMHAFLGIAQSQNTSLATVAPGIAEALITTAVGLAVAIPASVAYNACASVQGRVSRLLCLSVAELVRQTALPATGGHADAA